MKPIRDVTIYVEGGGPFAGKRKRLRRGMDRFLHELTEKALANGGSVKPIFCGDRNQTYVDFMTARSHANVGEIIVLLVDAEGPVNLPTPVEHLCAPQGDGWDLKGVENDHVHLMVQTMETWIVADHDALKLYYKGGFHEKALPKHHDLEDIDKSAIKDALERATKDTKKGRYHKIDHASDLLTKINPEKVRNRCPYCKRLFSIIDAALASG